MLFVLNEERPLAFPFTVDLEAFTVPLLVDTMIMKKTEFFKN